jgi:teichuronic acid biosynthesis glycosyltransferase TuaC
MNILLYVNSFLPTIGGKEIVVHYLAKELQKAGNFVRVVGPSGWIRKRNQQHEYPVHRWPTMKGYYPEKVGYAQLFLDTAIWGCDVIHAHTTYPNGYIASLLKQKRRLPLVITPHGRDIHVIPELGFGHRLDPVKNQKIKYALKNADIVTAISDSVESSLLDAGCDISKICRIPNGIDIERFNLDKSPNVHNWLGWPKHKRLILSVGNYHPRKGQEIIVEAMPLILSKIPDARLVIVGANQETLAEKVRALKLEDYIRLTGSIPFLFSLANGDNIESVSSKDRLAALYCQSEVYISASISKEAEGLSLAMLDAMASGLPVVATRISGSSDIVINGKTGFLVPPADHQALAESITAVLENKNKSMEMGQQGKLIVQSYHWKQISEQYIQCYRNAIGRTNKPLNA